MPSAAPLISGPYDNEQAGVVDMDREGNQGGALGSAMVDQGPIPTPFWGRRDGIKSRRSRALRRSSKRRMSRLSRLVGIVVMLFVILVMFGGLRTVLDFTPFPGIARGGIELPHQLRVQPKNAGFHE